MKIIGLGHYSRTGKDTFANRLATLLKMAGINAVKRPFAWKLKQICYELYAWDGMREPEFYDTPEGAKLRDVPLPNIGKTPVQIWVDFGTPAVRDQVYGSTWIEYALNNTDGIDVLIIPDVRFANEFVAIEDRGGHLIKVVRPGYGPRDTVADQALKDWTRWHNVIGDEHIETLWDQAAIYASRIMLGDPLPVWTDRSNSYLALHPAEPAPVVRRNAVPLTLPKGFVPGHHSLLSLQQPETD